MALMDGIKDFARRFIAFSSGKAEASSLMNHSMKRQDKLEYCQGCDGQLRWIYAEDWVNQEDLSTLDTYPFAEWQTPGKWVYSHRLDHVVLDGFFMIYFKDDKPIEKTNHFITGDLLNSLKVDPEKQVICEEELVFSCFDHWDTNYYHWIAHAIPAYFAAMHSGKKGKYLVPAGLTAWQKRTLELLGLDMSLCYPVAKDKQYVFQQVEYIEHATGETDFVVSQLTRTAYEKMAVNVLIPNREELCHDKIYISRLSKEHRHLSNERELAESLEKRGFFLLDPEAYTIDEQIRIFNNAKMVVALLGAGLANIAFCKPGTLIYEIIPSHHQNPCFLTMSVQGNLRYYADNFDTGVRNTGPDHLSDWQNRLDVAYVEKRLDMLEPYLAK